MRVIDSRRLTGPNVIWDRPGAVIDVECAQEVVDALTDVWERAARRMLDAVGWHDEQTQTRQVVAGVSLALSAPVDALYVATELAEWAFDAAKARLEGASEPDFEVHSCRLREAVEAEGNPPLMALKHVAEAAGLAFLSDDDEVSVGMGAGSRRWNVHELPDPGAVDWDAVHDIPVGLVTGTNGKTTTVRLAAAIAMTARRGVGISSTEWISVDGEVIEKGDYAGPGGARTVLREPNSRLAILEAARGGLLRRGLGVRHADAVAITTLAEDHLGDFGSANLEELAAIKWVLTRALRPDGRLVLNADDELLVALGTDVANPAPAPIIWCSLDPEHAVLRAHLNSGGEALTVVDNQVIYARADQRQSIIAVDAIPLTLGGVARHNLSNALTAAALCHGLGLGLGAIAEGLAAMTPSDNPGRSNLFSLDGATILVDFAHNPQAMQAIIEMAVALPAQRRALSFGQAGDRTDQQMRELARFGWGRGLDHVMIAELAQYRRGRAAGEVPALLRDEFLVCGATPEQISLHDGEIACFRAALEWSRPGDLVVQIALSNNVAILEELTSRGAREVGTKRD